MLQNIFSWEDLFGKKISWPITVVMTVSLLANNLFNKPALLASIIWFSYLNFDRAKQGLNFNFVKAYGIILFELWAALSMFWTAVPSTSLNILLVQLSLLFLTFLISLEALDKDLAISLKISAYLIIAINLIFCVIFYSKANSAIGLKGLYAQKNNFGVILAICNFILLYAGKLKKRDFLFIVPGVLMLILTQSKTSILIFVLIVLMISGFKAIAYYYNRLSPYNQGFIRLNLRVVPFIFYILILLTIFYREAIADYLIHHVSDEFMTGRGLIWTTILARTADHLLIGIGPGVYFESDSASEIFKTFLYFNNPLWVEKLAGADNGYVDIISSLGFIGLALLFLSYVQNYRLLFALKNHENAALIFALMTFFVLDNISESSIYHSMNSPWLLYLMICFYLVHLNAKQLSQQ
jgi:hypothetical protein